MTNLIRRFFTRRPAPVQEGWADAKLDTVEGKAATPTPPTYFQGVPCAKCGGFFQPTSLKPFYRGSVRFTGVGDATWVPHFETVSYCLGCEPVAPIVFVLQDDKGRKIDTRYFKVEDGWFQDVDDKSGEDRYTLSSEDYNHTFCTNCGELIEETECQRHRTPVKTAKKGKS